MIRCEFSLDNKIEWLTVSNAFFRSKKATALKPRSILKVVRAVILLKSREDKGDREGIPLTSLIP